jgi:uncharacterized protein (UPF0335 family)
MNFENVSGQQLRQIIDKIETIEKEKQEISQTLKEAFSEAKGYGFDLAVIKEILKNRKIDQNKLSEHEELMTVYMNALAVANN